MYICKHFQIHELVDPDTYNQFAEAAWMFFCPAALQALDLLRDYFGAPIVVNNWRHGGEFKYRGFRPVMSSVGGNYSQHRMGRAFDLDVIGYTANEVRRTIIINKDMPSFRLINCLETDINWVHFDTRNISDRIRIVTPK